MYHDCHLGKSTGMNQSFGGGWILFGHVFAKEGEHDQAMNCYTKVCILYSSPIPFPLLLMIR
jgi:hypothetical protein